MLSVGQGGFAWGFLGVVQVLDLGGADDFLALGVGGSGSL
jgi:hypothetical protein